MTAEPMTRVNIFLPPEMVERLKEQKERTGVPVAEFVRRAIEAGVIDKDSRFGLHGLKHRGVTDTPGRKADKKAASGHKTDAMLDIYDHELQVVDPAGRK